MSWFVSPKESLVSRLEAESRVIEAAFQSFEGLPHRSQLVGERAGVRHGRLQPDYMHREALDVLPALLRVLPNVGRGGSR